MGNSFAYFALFAWPLLTFYFFVSSPPHKAVVKTLLGAALLLPVRTGVNVSMLPLLNKHTLPILTLYILGLFLRKARFSHFTKCKLTNVLVVIFVLSHIGMWLTNQEPVNAVTRYVPGYTFHSVISLILLNFLSIASFFVGRHHFKSLEHHRYLFAAIIVSALFYSLLILFELKMSPNIHSNVYGFFPHSFRQMLRAGGYRPVVFLGHGLLVSMFLTTAIAAAATFWKNKWKVKFFVPPLARGKTASIFLMTLLVFSKSVASIVYGAVLLVSAMLISSKRTALIALILAATALAYPLAKLGHMVPTQSILSVARSMTNAERELSLRVRFENEDEIVDKVRRKVFFGWGGWARYRVFDRFGRGTITDGYWIIKLGELGFFGFYSLFGVIFLAVYKAYKAVKVSGDEQERRLMAMHALFVAILFIDQIPNSSLTLPFWWLIIGALMGRSEAVLEQSEHPETPAELSPA